MKKITVIAALLCSAAVCAYAQQSDGTLSGAVYTVSLDGEREPGRTFLEILLRSDNQLDEAVVTARGEANYLSRLSNVKTEVISSAGLNKMACCNLAESFENSAAVSVGYSDAVTGARQIRLLGLSGIYTAMLDENRPVMRGLAAPFGLSYIPGQWLESIQIAKGPSSVINGVEAISGQINVEHRKPTDEKPLFLNAFINSMLMAELNAASSLQIGNRWSTVPSAGLCREAGGERHEPCLPGTLRADYPQVQGGGRICRSREYHQLPPEASCYQCGGSLVP